MPFTYDYPRPAVTTDVVAFTMKDGALSVLLVKRKFDPFAQCWAFPGGFVDMDEDLAHAARRELEEETGLKDVTLSQFHTFGAPDRDPRGRTITVAYLSIIPVAKQTVRAADDALEADWFPLSAPPALAFDHDHILQTAVQALRDRHKKWRDQIDPAIFGFSAEDLERAAFS
ncbi:NUDIX domain-containing protein [Sneathiella chinensis]|uniref:Nudix hydrolase domain-containing protein n=1 Tax=Sneathiella chinensis TaxID=349750 RepID=A0ABQ5U5L5_9PROT|nr:NUDIX hydrolase [Sneathiella chinensis]GLQ06528.1 hypothetical protein GCM10007924_17490 [Sneathiella chinensis]